MPPSGTPTRHSAGEVFLAFLRLGCTSFGGPIAHLGYFQAEFVLRRRWLNAEEFTDLLALCQFLPGPSSSQLGLAIGAKRAGWRGAALAWLGFTLPSATLMVAFAYGLSLSHWLLASGALTGLQVAAAAVIGVAVVTLARRLCPDRRRAAVATLSTGVLLWWPGTGHQLAVIAAGGLIGLVFHLETTAEPAAKPRLPRSWRPSGLVWCGGYAALLLILPWLARGYPAAAMASACYRAGALVLGGGHVVLPLLEQATVERGWIGRDTFLAGYGMTQALPGPLFTFAAFLGAEIPPGGVVGALLALGAIFLPGALILFGVLPQWDQLRGAPAARHVLAGANAAVVGVLAAVFCRPVCTTTLTDWRRTAVAAAAFGVLFALRRPVWLVILACALAGILWL